MGVRPHLLRGGALSFFDPQGAFLLTCRQGSFPWLRSGYLICLLQQSSLLLGAFILGLSGGNRASVLLCLTNTNCPAQGPILSPTSRQLTLLEFGREFFAGVIGIEALGLDGPRKRWRSRWLGIEPGVAIFERVSRRKEINDGNWEGAAREKLRDVGDRLHRLKKSTEWEVETVNVNYF